MHTCVGQSGQSVGTVKKHLLLWEFCSSMKALVTMASHPVLMPVSFMAKVKWDTTYCIDCCFTREKHLWSAISLKPGKVFLEGIFIVEIRRKHIPELISAGETHTRMFSPHVLFLFRKTIKTIQNVPMTLWVMYKAKIYWNTKSIVK